MSLVRELTGRRAFRALSDRAVPADLLGRVFEAASLAPSCGNMQPWRYVAVQNAPLLGEVKALLTPGNYWAQNAPLIIAAWTHVDYDVRNPDGRDFALFDLGQSVMALQLQAEAEGLIAHPIAGFNMPAARALLGLPEDGLLTVLLVCGYPGSDEHLSDKHKTSEHGPRVRKPYEENVSFR